MLGAGFGGLELTSRLSGEFGDRVEIVLIDQSDAFVFGFSKLDVMFGRTIPDHVRHPYRDIVKPGVQFVQTTVRSIDPSARRVETDAGAFEGDYLVVALGATLTRPRHRDCSREATTSTPWPARSRRAMRSSASRAAGSWSASSRRLQVPAGAERDRAADEPVPDRRGLRDKSEIALVIDFGRPIPPSPDASELLIGAFAEREIEWHPRREVCELDPVTQCGHAARRRRDALRPVPRVPVHRAPQWSWNRV